MIMNNEYEQQQQHANGNGNDIYNNDNTNVYIGKTNDVNGMEVGTNISSYKTNNKNIYRFKFSDEFSIELSNFAKIHQYDDRHIFKEEWNLWLEQNENLVETEVRFLMNNGYHGDIIDKMFKSARYYFRKKSTSKKEPKERKPYMGVTKEFMDNIDKYLVNNNDKPSEGFEKFCLDNVELLRREIKHMMLHGMNEYKEIMNKIKKTYKNRYFVKHGNKK